MNPAHQPSALQMLSATPRQLHLRGLLRLQAQQAGWLQVAAGQVWITRGGDAGDHVLAGGDVVFVGRGQSLLVEPWRQGDAARLHWALAEPAALPVAAARAGAQRDGLRGLAPASPGLAGVAALRRAAAGVLRGAAGRLAAAARSAEAMASRAQGSISAGDSMASSGALQ